MCCGKEAYEEVKEGRVGLTRRKVLRAMGVGTGFVMLGGLTGCTQFLEGMTGIIKNETHVVTAQEVIDIAEETKISWKTAISNYIELECHQSNQLSRLKDSLRHAQLRTIEFANLTVFACAAAALICKLCSGGGGGVVIEP